MSDSGNFLFGDGNSNRNRQVAQPKRDAQGNPLEGEPIQKYGESQEDYLKRRMAWYDGGPGDIQVETDPYKAWQDPQAEKNRADLAAQRDKYEGRVAPRMNAEQTNLSNLERVQGQQGSLERGYYEQLAPAERVGNINIGNANTAQGAIIDPAAQARAAQLGRQDAEFRSAQTNLMGQLQDQAAGRGPSLAASQYQEAADRNIASQVGAASAMGGRNAGLAQRQLATNAAAQGQQTARDVSNIRMQEQMQARQQLGGLSQVGREQDINVANAQAQLQQQAALSNQAALNSRAAQQAQLGQQSGQFNASMLNDRQLQQAQLNAQLALSNQNAGNQFALQQGQMGQQMNLANMQAANQMSQFNAQQRQQSNLANQQYYNQGMFSNTENRQQQNMSNLQAQLQNQQMNDQMARYYSEAGLGNDARQQQAMMAYQALQTQKDLGFSALEQKASESSRTPWGSILGAAGSLITLSDEDVKNSVTRGDSNIKGFLDQYMNAISSQNSQMMGGGSGSSDDLGAGISGLVKGVGTAIKNSNTPAPSGDIIREDPYTTKSDENAKTDIKGDLDDQLSQFLNNIQAHEYKYKDEYKNSPGGGEGKFVSPMAQELQKTDLGKSAVKPDADGTLSVDYGKLGGVMLASQAYLNQRLNELEGKKGKK